MPLYTPLRKIEKRKETTDKRAMRQIELNSRDDQKQKTMKDRMMSRVNKDAYLKECERKKEGDFLF
jgi:hypothetical protein